MAFTYSLSHPEAAKVTISKIRLRMGDTVANAGPLPNGGNLQDEEIAELYAAEGNHIMRTVAACLEMLAAAWAAHAGTYRLGPESEESYASERYEKAAKAMRDRYGFADDDAATARRAVVVAGVRPEGQG